MHRPAGSSAPHSDRGVGRRRPGLASRRVLWLSFGISALVHGTFVVIYPTLVAVLSPENASFSFPGVSGAPQGVEVIRIVQVSDVPDPERPEDPEQIEDLAEPDVVSEGPVIDGLPTGQLVRPPLSGAELLRPHLTDRRLWGPPDPEDVALTMEQREQLLLAGSLEAWYDSLAAAAAAESALTDWTVTDSKGKRWGVSPGKLHLGDITLPLPFSFGTPPGKRDEANQRLWQWEEISRQGARAEIQDSWKERSEAIRARLDRERAKARPDTTRSRR